jgi:hypothetical protein
MSRINLDDNRTWGLQLGPRTVLQTEQGVQITADVVSADSPPAIFLNPAGAINMRLPPANPATAGAARKGQIFVFVNLSANVVTLQTTAGAGFTTAVTVAANAATRVICTGNTSEVLGWVIW